MRIRKLASIAAGVIFLTATPLLAQRFPLPPPPPLPDIHVRIAPSPPPIARHVVVGVRPAPGYVWCDGYWDYGPSGWYWISGHWAPRPRPHVYWVAPRYHRVYGSWRVTPGHWSHQRVWYGGHRDRDRDWDRHRRW